LPELPVPQIPKIQTKELLLKELQKAIFILSEYEKYRIDMDNSSNPIK